MITTTVKTEKNPWLEGSLVLHFHSRSHFPCSLPPWTLAATKLSLCNLLFQECFVHGTRYVVHNLWDWLFSLKVVPLWFLQLVACSSSLFLFAAERYSVAWMYHHLLNHSPVEEYLGCFQFGAIMNKAAKYCSTSVCMNISFYFSGINAQEYNCWVKYSKCKFSFIRKTPNYRYFPEWLYYLTSNVCMI